jgi:hypothetical protein
MCAVFAGSIGWPCLSGAALAADKDAEGEEEEGPFQPAVYLDYRTTFSALPPSDLGCAASRACSRSSDSTWRNWTPATIVALVSPPRPQGRRSRRSLSF